MRRLLLLLLGLAPAAAKGSGDRDHCHACHATSTELHKRLKRKGSHAAPYAEADIVEALEGICSFESFRVYDYPPPKMVKLCQDVLDGAEEAFEAAWQLHLEATEVQNKVCHHFCDGVDMSAEAKRDPGKPQIFMDGEPIEAGSTVRPKRKSKKKKSKKKQTKKSKTSKKKRKKRKKTNKKKGSEL